MNGDAEHPPASDLPLSPTGAPSAPLPHPAVTEVGSPTLPLLVWLLLQLAALLLAAARVPLAAKYPAAGERWAVYLVLAAQFGGGAVLMPLLLRDWRTALLAIATAWPILAVAGLLSTVPPARVAACGIHLTIWLAALVMWRAALRSPRAIFTAAAIATLATIGGPLLAYLSAEFGEGVNAGGVATPVPGPLLSAWSLVTGGVDFWSAAAPSAALAGLGLLAVAVRGRFRRTRAHADAPNP